MRRAYVHVLGMCSGSPQEPLPRQVISRKSACLHSHNRHAASDAEREGQEVPLSGRLVSVIARWATATLSSKKKIMRQKMELPIGGPVYGHGQWTCVWTRAMDMCMDSGMDVCVDGHVYGHGP